MEIKKAHILIADGDGVSAEKMKTALEKGGYTAEALVCDGIDAADACLKINPDVVFVDKELDLIGGLKAAACMRSGGYDGIVILLSKAYDENLSERLPELGINGCIVKPVTEKFLLPWLHTKLTRDNDLKFLSNEKNTLLSALENRRLVEEANGIIAASKNVSIAEADKILTEKAKEKNVTKEELAKIFVSVSAV